MDAVFKVEELGFGGGLATEGALVFLGEGTLDAERVRWIRGYHK